ncbi:MAG: hypothetical protein ABW098_06520 [Candidatus Thiodiazotropha sp.]
MKRFLMSLFITALSVGCTSNQPKPTASDDIAKPVPHEYLVRKPSFTNCELEALITHTAGRQAIVFKATQESLLATKNARAFQKDMINELFARINDNGFRDYPMFAAEKFYQCIEREGVSIKKNLGGAAVCLARQDIPFYLYAKKQSGSTLEETTAFVKKLYENSSKEIYPETLIEQTAKMVYRAKNTNDFYNIRRLSFETCLFPKEWKAWWESQQAAKKETN